MAFKTSATAPWTILTSSARMPSGRCPPSAFGMYVRRAGSGAASVAIDAGEHLERPSLCLKHTNDGSGGVEV